MYHRRLKIFVGFCVGILMIAVVRLVYLQLHAVEKARQETEQMRFLLPQQLPTVRGKIFDRNGLALATDRAVFSLHINYQLTRYADARWRQGQILRQAGKDRSQAEVEAELQTKWADSQQMLNRAVELAARLGAVSPEQIQSRIEEINDRIWELSRYMVWRRRNPGLGFADYRRQRDAILLVQIVRVDLEDMYKSYPLIDLTTDEALLSAQLELVDMEGLSIEPQAQRVYPFRTAACQLLGWVGPGSKDELELFEEDEYQCYLEGEVLGKDGIEKAFEPMLRGRRGSVVYDKDGNEVSRTPPMYGNDVPLTLDVVLQQAIEAFLLDPQTNPNAASSCAAVVLDGATNDILAAVSTPVFDLNTVRRDYAKLINEPNRPMTHKALERNYPPGSTAKPLVLLIGLEEGKIQPEDIIHCTYHPPAKGWPRCLLQRNYGSCHDARWEGQGGNTARNAMRGSCNIYFSQLAHRLDGRKLQSGLFDLGLGQAVLRTEFPQAFIQTHPQFSEVAPRIRQAHGNLIYDPVKIVQPVPAASVDDLGTIPDWERKWWGIGQGNLRATVLQIANALSIIARNGLVKSPRLVLDETDFFNERHQRQLPIAKRTFRAVREGMSAVVNEEGGSAFGVFYRPKSDLFARGIKIYGKTGSTQNPEHAWFECFAEDKAGRIIVVAVLVEGGARGSDDAAPLGRGILTLCSDASYIGERPANVAQ